jgi:integrase
MTAAKRDLTDRAIRALKPAAPGKRYIEPDGQVAGFGVRVTDKGHKTFVLVTRYPGASQPAPRAIGDYPTVELAKARDIAREWKEDVKRGVDPREKAEAARRHAEAAKRAAERQQANTFRAAFQAFKEEHLSTLRTGAVVAAAIENHVMDALGDRPLGEITRAEGNEVVRSIAIAKRSPTSARRVKSYLHKFGRWCEEDGRIEEAPFAGLRRFGKEQARDRVLKPLEIRAIWTASAEMGAFGRSVRLMLATGQRRGEVGEATWPEIDVAERLWSLPRERMKADRAHLVPLSPLALSILSECPKRGAHVFSTRSTRDGGTIALSGWSKFKQRLDALAVKALRELAGDPDAAMSPWRLHDLRRTCASLMTAGGVPRLTVSKVLGHAEQGVTGQHYDLYEYLREKRQALDLWGERLKAIVDEGREGSDSEETFFSAPLESPSAFLH